MNFSFLILALTAVVFAKPQDLSLANQYFKDAVYRSAADYYQRYLTENPEASKIHEARLGLAKSYHQMGDFEAAIRSYDEYLNGEPSGDDVAKALFASAEVLGKLNKNHRAAERYYVLALQGKGTRYEMAHFLSVERAFAAGDMENVKLRANTFLKKYSKGDSLPRVHLFLAKALRAERNLDLAIQHLDFALERKEEQEARFELAELLLETGNALKAVESFKKALFGADSVKQKKAYQQVVGIFHREKKQNDLVTFWGEPHKILAGDVEKLRVAEALIFVKRVDEALALLESLSLTEKELQVEKKLLMAKAMLSLGERFQGIHLLKMLGEEGEIRAWDEVAKAYYEDGMYLPAIQSIYRAVELESAKQKPYRLLEIAEIYEQKLHRYGTARGVYEQFERDFPNHEKTAAAILGVARCYYAEEEWKAAARYYQRIIEDYPMTHELAEATGKFEYLVRHRVADIEGALSVVLNIPDTLEMAEKQMLKAQLQFEKLKNYREAHDLLVALLDQKPERELREKALFLQSKILMAQADRFGFDGKVQQKNNFLEKARVLLESFVADTIVGLWDDDAEWELLQMNPINLQSYNQFIEKYKGSPLVALAHLRLGNHYLQETRELGLPHSEKAVLHFLEIMNLPVDEKVKLEAILGAAEANYWAGNLEQAASQMKIYEQIPKESLNPDAFLINAKILSAQEKWVESMQAYKNLHYRFRNHPMAGNALLEMAKVQMQLKKNEEAKKNYRLFISSYPNHKSLYEAYAGMAYVQEVEGKWEKAREVLFEFTETQKEHPSLDQAYGKMAFLSQLLDDRQVSAEYYGRAVELAPAIRKSEYAFPAAEAYLRLEEYEKALPLYREAIAQATKPKEKAKAWSGELACLVTLGEKDAYLNGYKNFKKEFEEFIDAHARIIYYDARKNMDNGSVDKAEKRFDYLASRFEESPWANEGAYYLGVMAFKKGRFNEAITKFQAYLMKSELGQSAVDAKFKLASAYFQQSQFDKSAALYFELSEGKQGSALLKYRARYNAALTYEKLNLWYKAALMYARIFERDEQFLTNSNMKVSAGFAWFRAGEFAKSLGFFKEVVEDQGSERKAEAHFWYAKNLDHLNRVEEAIEEYLKVNYLYRGDGMWGLTSLFEVGQIYERSADFERAERMYKQIVEQDGTQGTLGSRALVYLEKMRERMGLKQHGAHP